MNKRQRKKRDKKINALLQVLMPSSFDLWKPHPPLRKLSFEDAQKAIDRLYAQALENQKLFGTTRLELMEKEEKRAAEQGLGT